MSKIPPGVFTLAKGLLLSGNIRVVAFTSMVTGIYVSMLNTILQPFVVDSLGLSLPILGILVAVGARPLGVASSIAQPFGGALADILGRKSLVVAGSGVGIASMLAFLLAAQTRSLVPLSIGYVLFGLSLLGYPATQATIAETVAMDPGKVNVAFSVVFFFTALPGAFIPFATGYLAAVLGYAALFAAAALLESSNLIILISLLDETHPLGAKQIHRFSLSGFMKVPRSFLKICIPFAMDAFFYGLAGSIIYGLWTAQFGFTTEEIGLIYGALSVSIVVSQYFATRLLLKAGTRLTLALSEFLTVVVMVGWVVSPTLPALILLAVIFGVSVAAWVPAQSSLLMAAAPIEARGGLAGKLAAFRGLASVPAPIIGGYLFIAYGYYLPVSIGLVGEIFTTLAILKLIPRQG